MTFFSPFLGYILNYLQNSTVYSFSILSTQVNLCF